MDPNDPLDTAAHGPTPADSPTQLSGLARKLVDAGFITLEVARSLSSKAAYTNTSFYQQLWAQDAIEKTQLIEFVSKELAIPAFDIEAVNLDKIPLNALTASQIRRNRCLPLIADGDSLTLAIGDPEDRNTIESIGFNSGTRVHGVLCDRQKLGVLIDQLLNSVPTSIHDNEFIQHTTTDIDLSSELGLERDNHPGTENEPDTPIVRFVTKVLQDAILKSASDVHFETYENETRVRYRIDGLLHEIAKPPKELAAKIISRLKVIAQLNIADRRLPQDGRIKISLSKDHVVDFRVSTLPTLFGEKMVVRVLDAAKSRLDLDKLGMDQNQLALYRQACAQPHGMILVTGPTGSGKTISLYSALKALNTPHVNISSVEDPIEIFVSGINQVNVDTKTGLTFSKSLRALLRQDPDILMVGEIRDLETAEISVKAAQTGHLVLSTLHTNDASGALIRLLNMGVAPFNLSSSVNLVVAQRLVRKLCPICRAPTNYSETALASIGFKPTVDHNLELYQARGCGNCVNGYLGRTGIFEVMPISPAIADLILSRQSHAAIGEQAKKEGVHTMQQSGLNKVALGITSVEEIERVTMA